jgi:hypothetical protein
MDLQERQPLFGRENDMNQQPRYGSPKSADVPSAAKRDNADVWSADPRGGGRSWSARAGGGCFARAAIPGQQSLAGRGVLW